VKILIYTVDFAPSIGGVQTITAILAKGLAEWSTPANGGPAETNDVTVVTRTPAGTMDDSHFPFRVVRLSGVARLYRLMRDADIIHVVGPAILPMAMGLFLRKPVIVGHHGYQAICPSGNYLHQPNATLCPGHFQRGHYFQCFRCQATEVSLGRSARNIFLMFPRRWLAKRVAANVGPSDHTGRRIALPRGQTIYHGIEDAFSAEDSRPVNHSPMCFLYLGRLVPEKGVDLLLAAAAKVRQAGDDFRLKIVGDGPERYRLESTAEELGLKGYVKFLGYRQGSELLEALAGVSTSVIPSRCEEACPVTAIEQMMRGQLMIVTDLGGIGEVVGGAGLKFPPGDADALAACISRVIHDPDLVLSLGAAARRRAIEVFSKNEMLHQHLELYAQHVYAPRNHQ
jgi:glycosyltransferase involved in cell wall biosynthesis